MTVSDRVRRRALQSLRGGYTWAALKLHADAAHSQLLLAAALAEGDPHDPDVADARVQVGLGSPDNAQAYKFNFTAADPAARPNAEDQPSRAFAVAVSTATASKAELIPAHAMVSRLCSAACAG